MDSRVHAVTAKFPRVYQLARYQVHVDNNPRRMQYDQSQKNNFLNRPTTGF